MIEFLAPRDDAPELTASPILRVALLTLDYLQVNGPIGLTPAKALKRYFVTWAAQVFDWPHYTAQDLFAINKVLNEDDFQPLIVLHDVLLSARLVRHRKGQLHISKVGKELAGQPGRLWVVLAEHLLVAIDHSKYTRFGDRLEGDWHMFLDIANLVTHEGASEDHFCAALLGIEEADLRHDYMLRPMVYIHVLRPLCWLGLLHETPYGKPYAGQRLFTKTALWFATLKLATDKDLPTLTRH